MIRRGHAGWLALLLASSCGKPAQQVTSSSTSPAGETTPAKQAASASTKPALVFLHGLGGRGRSFAESVGGPALANQRGLELLAPDGAVDRHGRHFWNATRACCDFDETKPDHVTALRALAENQKSIVVGFSNGAFMAQRLACDSAKLGAIVSLAGAAASEGDPPCQASPVAFIHVHGDRDGVVPFAGGHVLGDSTLPVVPSAQQTFDRWRTINGCRSDQTAPPRALDLLAAIPGPETRVIAALGCRAKTELWVIEGGDHGAPASPEVVQAALAQL